MKKALLLFLILFISCGQNCNDLQKSFKTYDEALSVILRTKYSYTDSCDVSMSSFITSAHYYSCDGVVGFLIIGINEKKYVYEDVPFEDVWQGFKDASSKGKYYNKNIKGRYLLKVKN
jgi:hypothetical protein